MYAAPILLDVWISNCHQVCHIIFLTCLNNPISPIKNVLKCINPQTWFKIRKEIHKLSVNSLRVVGVCLNILVAMLHHALYYCVFFPVTLESGLKMEKCCQSLVDEFHWLDFKDSCIINSLEYWRQITLWHWLTVRFPKPQSLPKPWWSVRYDDDMFSMSNISSSTPTF